MRCLLHVPYVSVLGPLGISSEEIDMPSMTSVTRFAVCYLLVLGEPWTQWQVNSTSQWHLANLAGQWEDTNAIFLDCEDVLQQEE